MPNLFASDEKAVLGEKVLPLSRSLSLSRSLARSLALFFFLFLALSLSLSLSLSASLHLLSNTSAPVGLTDVF